MELVGDLMFLYQSVRHQLWLRRLPPAVEFC